MFSTRRLCCQATVTACWMLLASCDSQTEVDKTIPTDNETDVDSRSIVAVELNNGFTQADTAALDPKNFIVTGDLTDGPYSGTLTLARHSQVFRGQTVEEFQAAAAEPPGDGGDSEDPATAKKNDTIVFLLPSGVRFKDGENIRVTVKSKVTANGTPIRSHRTFTFRIRGGAGATGDLKVVSADPAPGTADAEARPRLSFTFNRAVKGDNLKDALVVRGEQSGVHTGGDTLFTRTEAANRVLAVVRRLAAGDALAPGEIVSVTLSAELTEAVATPPAPAQKLQPYTLQFQVGPGQAEDGWELLDPAIGVEGPVSLVAADFRPTAAGVECAIVSASRLLLVSQLAERAWTTTSVDLPLSHEGKTYAATAGLAYDTEDDGIPEIVVLLESVTESRIVLFKVTDSGTLIATGLPVDLPVTGIAAMAVADLDASGKPELILSHLPGKYSPGAGEPLTNTGQLTLLQLALVPPDLEDIDPTNPDTLKPRPKFQPIHDAVKGFPLSQRIVAADLNGDGKLDLIAEQQEGLSLYRNIGAPGALLAFRRIGELIGRGGGELNPLAWAAADLDADGDQDVLAWDAQGALLHRNRHISEASDGGSDQVRGLLFESLPPEPIPGLPSLEGRARISALQMDGKAGLDLVVAPEGGALSVYLGDETGASFTVLPQAEPAVQIQSLALVDVDGDTGLDVATLLGGGEVRFHLASGVTPPVVSAPSEFRFAPEESGHTDLSSSTIRVGVLGDITELFSGYSLALDYDEKVLSYKGFEAPEDFVQVGSFELCPNASLQGCSGNAAARMTYRESTRGAPSSNVLLGTFLFQKPAVTSAATTLIELKSFPGANNTTFENAVRVVDGNAAVSLPATIDGPALAVMLEPPAPPALTVACEVTSRAAASLTGRVRWNSPAGVVFSQYIVGVGAEAPVLLPGTAAEHAFTTGQTGAVQVTVTARDADGEDTSATCQVIGVHAPSVTCVAVNTNENRVNWTLGHAVDRFVVYRNGTRLGQTADGQVTEFVDRSPSLNGADDYQVAGLLGGIEGPRASCAGGPVGDDNTEVTVPPQIIEAALLTRATAADPNTLRCRWINGEGYTSITVTVTRAGEASPFATQILAGTDTELLVVGDAAVGGVKPNIYTFSVQGRVGGLASEAIRSSPVSVPVPILAVPLTCPVDATGAVRLSWFPVWRGYSTLKLITEHRATPTSEPTRQEEPLDFETVQRTIEGLAPTGTYDFRLVASYEDPLPQSLTPVPGALERRCQVAFASRLLVGRVEAGVGMQGVEIPVRAEALGLVSGYHFELEYPSFLDVDPVAGLKLSAPGAQITEFTLGPGTTAGTTRASVTVTGASLSPDADGDGDADGQIELARLVGNVPADFTLGGDHPLLFTGVATLSFAGEDNVPVDTDGAGKLVLRRRYVVMDRVSVPAGSQETLVVRARGTFDAPSGAPNYRLNAFTLHVQYDPALLEALLVTDQDQAQTVVAGRGTYFLPNEVAIAAAKTTGDLRMSWLGFNLANPSAPPQFVVPGVNMNLVFLKFRSKVPGDSPARSIRVGFVSAANSSDLPTAFHPEVDVPGEPDLEAVFDGRVDVTSTVPALSIQGIAPAQGSLLGGNEAVITGSGFLPPGGSADDVAVSFFRPGTGTTSVELPVMDLLSVTSSAIRLRIPDSGIRSPVRLSTPADIVVALPGGSRRLVAGYSYEYPRLSAFDLRSGRASGGELMAITGFGLAPTSTVAFRVPGLANPVAAVVSRVDADGKRLLVLTPNLVGQEGKSATVEVTVPGVATIPAPGTYAIVPDGGGMTLKLSSVAPAGATICGGTEVVLTGEGFLAELQVSFGAVEAAAVTVESATRARAITPSVPEGTQVVTVTVSNGVGLPASLTNAFTFTHPAPPFKRGDVTSNGTVDVSDVSILSAIVVGEPATLPLNLDAVDVNDDGQLDGGDVTALLEHLFGGRLRLPEPFTTAPGLDPTPDSITSCGS